MIYPQFQLLTISRPRFYSYLFGTFLVGSAAGFVYPQQITSSPFLAFLLFFIFPANIFLYGINDIFDTQTDVKNPKKFSHEHLLQYHERLPLIATMVSIFLLTVVSFLFLTKLQVLLLASFLFLSFAYSSPPFRFKEIPFADAYSNILYAFPGFFGYALFTGAMVPPLVFQMALFWTAGMHALSAIPDISVDKQAGITTTAVYLGEEKTRIFILLNWTLFAVLACIVMGAVGILGCIYPAILLYAKWQKKSIESIYWYFPYINTAVGFCAFWYILLSRFGFETLWNTRLF